jgi:triosephosphate isomerase
MVQARRPLIAGNWKMNGTRETTDAFMAALHRAIGGSGGLRCEVLLCPPATLIVAAAEAAAGGPVAVGGQDCHAAATGAHTGDLAAEMVADAGGRYVIVGHSERRADHGEGDAVVHAKAEAAHRAGLTAIICVGESEAERDAGDTLAVVAAQLAGSVPADGIAANTVVAYEPVWAIGTGRTPTAAEVAEVHARIRDSLAGALDDGGDVRILYGGSVKPANAAELLALDDVDGALVGGASLAADDFFAIIDSCP